MITINNFVGEFILCKTPEAKEAYVQKHLVHDYLPYAKKMEIAANIVQTAHYKEVPMPDNSVKKVFAPNTPICDFLEVIEIVKNYTDIIIVTDEMANDDESIGLAITNAFNRLEQNGIIALLIKLLDIEYQRLEKVIKMKQDDVFFIESNLPSYIDTKIDSFGITAGQLADLMANSPTESK